MLHAWSLTFYLDAPAHDYVSENACASLRKYKCEQKTPNETSIITKTSGPGGKLELNTFCRVTYHFPSGSGKRACVFIGAIAHSTLAEFATHSRKWLAKALRGKQ